MESLWDRLIADCSLRPVLIPDAAGPTGPHRTEQELERRDAFIRLSNAEFGGREVMYELVAGKKSLVKEVGAALGFERVTESVRRVRRG